MQDGNDTFNGTVALLVSIQKSDMPHGGGQRLGIHRHPMPASQHDRLVVEELAFLILANVQGKLPAVILIDPKYPHNVGAALRSCSCFGLKQLWWTGTRVGRHGEPDLSAP
jgi:hypothetical protein